MSVTNYNGYIVEGELTTKNSGFAKWGFANKDGKKYFLKEFLSPVYPEDETMFTPKQLEKKKKGCKNFEETKRELYRRLNEASDGNAVRVEAFFRLGSKYYMTMERVSAMNWEPKDVYWLSYKERILICKILAHCIMMLHKNGIVHADLKWDNILFERKNGEEYSKLTVKVIDFDNSFLADKSPQNPEDINVDQVYCAPETFLFLNGEAIRLDKQLDVYALGLIFHQVLTGELPGFDEKYQYTFEAAIDEADINLSWELTPKMFNLIGEMLNKIPEQRITSEEVFMRLCKGNSKEINESILKPSDLGYGFKIGGEL